MRLVTYRERRRRGPECSGDEGVIDAAEVARQPSRLGVRELIAAGRLEELAGGVDGTDAEPVSAAPSCCRRSPIPTRSSASASTTARTPRRPGSTRPSSPPSSPSSATRSPPPGADGHAAGGEREGRLRGRGRLRRSGGAARRSTRREALDAIAGYMLLNDLSARDLQFATPAVDAGQGLRRLGALRPGARHPRRGGRARRDLASPST